MDWSWVFDNWSTWFAVIIIVAYMTLSVFLKRLPNIPLGFLLLYFILSGLSPLLATVEAVEDASLWVIIGLSLTLTYAAIRLSTYLFVEIPYVVRKKTALPNVTRDFILLTASTVFTFIILRFQGNVNIAGLITTSAVLTAVIGLAAQGPLSNFFAGLMLQMERPFVLGDWIRIGEVEGRVIGVSWKATYLETRESIQVYIPNLSIADNTFENRSKPTLSQIGVLALGVEYGASPRDVEKVVLDVLEKIPGVQLAPKPEVRLVEFGDFAITYEIRFWHKNPAGEPKMMGAINRHLWYALRRAEIKIPFPIRDVQLAHREEEKAEREFLKLSKRIQKRILEVPVFSGLTDEDCESLAQATLAQEFHKGEIVVQQGAKGATMYIIDDGECVVSIEKGGLSQRVAELGPGDYFGEMTLLTGDNRAATVTAMDDAILLKIPFAPMRDLLGKHPSMADGFAQALEQRRKEISEKDIQVFEDPAINVNALVEKIRNWFKVETSD